MTPNQISAACFATRLSNLAKLTGRPQAAKRRLAVPTGVALNNWVIVTILKPAFINRFGVPL